MQAVLSLSRQACPTLEHTCAELFDAQDLAYRLSVFMAGSPVMSIEAAGVRGWERYAHAPFGIENSFGMSAPVDQIYNFFGFTVPNLTDKALQIVQYYSKDSAAAFPYAQSLVTAPRFVTPVMHAAHHK